MKKIIMGEELKKTMENGIQLIASAVGSTLGPKGNNVLINKYDTSPFITNDGVTIASSIESDDASINTILEIVKEASLKTNELVGDGTTTTIVLLENIFKEGLNVIRNGKNPIVLKEELDKTLESILELIDKYKKKPTKEELINIAKTSCNDDELGKFLADIFLDVKNKYAIKIEESSTEKTYVKKQKGYIFELDNVSNAYFLNSNEIVLNDTSILLLKGYLDDLEVINDFINESLVKNQNLLILAEDVSEDVKNQILSYYLDYQKNIFLFLLPDYISRKYAVIQDLMAISGGIFKSVMESISYEDLGRVSKVVINKDNIAFSFERKIDKYVNKLKKDFEGLNDYEKVFMAQRIASLDFGITTIYVGAITKTEMKEKKMRIEDAINALDIASRGVCLGAGITFFRISEEIKCENDGYQIMINSLKVPMQKIMNNCGEDYENLKNEIIKTNYQKIYNCKLRQFENINNTNILDPAEVLKTALKNAVSIASMLLTTNYLIINEKNVKIEEYI